MTDEEIAKVVHQANKAYCEALGDMSQVDWIYAEEWQRKGTIKGVRFHILNPDAKASHSHEEWKKEKMDDGWVYGDEKDAYRKTHPCMVPFEELPVMQQVKDFLFASIVEILKKLK